MLGPDEPRYAAIGETMAHTGDLVTPRLWGSPWFEKPPLLYWMTTAGYRAGLSSELAGRIPVVLLSLAFLATYFAFLRNQFGVIAASTSTLMLATSAGWLADSSLCLTDLPLSAFFSLAVLLSLSTIGSQRHQTLKFASIGASIGIAVLAKGLVPVALALPLLWFLRQYWRTWWAGLLAFTAVAVPWYWVVYRINGQAFIDEFFLKHHFERLYSTSLQHVQPWYFYGPVLLAIVFPWTPLLGLLLRKCVLNDRRLQLLATTVVFGIIIFSVSLNKLPGYLLPLMPSLFALMGVAIVKRGIDQVGRAWWITCAAFVGLIILVPAFLGPVLANEKLHWSLVTTPGADWLLLFVPVGAVLFLPRKSVFSALALVTIAGGLYIKARSFPLLDREVSARAFWVQLDPQKDRLCDAGLHRNWQYGLAFYAGHEVPHCRQKSGELRLVQKGNEPPSILVGPVH